jgi:cytochrome c553
MTKKANMKKLLFTAATFAMVFTACKSTKETTNTTTTKAELNCNDKALSYATDIKPILETNCNRCHNKNEKVEYNFLKFEEVKLAATKGDLLATIKHEKGYPKMPAYAAQLDQATIDKIECWIKNGMKE